VQPRRPDLTERIAAAIEGTDPDSGLTHRELAVAAYGVEDDPSAAQLSAVRRSVARLVAAGQAERGRRRYPRQVEIRRPLNEAECQAEADRREEFMERIEAKEQAAPYPVDTGLAGGFLGYGDPEIVEVQVAPVLIIREDGVELREAAA